MGHNNKEMEMIIAPNARMREIQDRNKARKQFVSTKKQAVEMLHQIERELLNRSFDGWGTVGDMGHYHEKIKELCDCLTNQGEYAEIATL
jgi:hypothetical protein